MSDRFPDPWFLQRTLGEFARGFEGLASLFKPGPGPGQLDLEGIQQALAAHYQGLFTQLAPTALAAPAGASAGAAFVRYQEAAARSGVLLAAIAREASGRFARSLAASGPDAPPITSLRELHALWIECGEAAYHDAAHREDFAEAQAALVGALAELAAQAPRA
ncbi:MAG TPA: poly(R)-hydroxyalkanoic acid synthase subunit PhaE [Steroidobacteraceae bacterium]|nr:poly(R)-hydroxyalkanoic acid synthase subunit PhaE [Steroidobacteraceae bacterium]